MPFQLVDRPRAGLFGKAKLGAIAGAMFGLAALLASPADAMDLTVVDSGMPLQVQLKGEIQVGDADRLMAELDKAKPRDTLARLAGKAPASTFDPRQWLWVRVESTGGNLEESLKLGRYLRSANALITTSDCTSACVFLLAGAVERVGLEEAVGRIGVHRPFFSDARQQSRSSLDQYFTDLHKELTEYLQEMHVPATLADIMFAVPPEEMRMLSAEELAVIFPREDPAWDELTVARRAAHLGVSSIAYRMQQASAWTCGGQEGVIASSFSQSAACGAAVRFDAPIDEFATYRFLFSGRCIAMPDFFVRRAGNADFFSCVSDGRWASL